MRWMRGGSKPRAGCCGRRPPHHSCLASPILHNACDPAQMIQTLDGDATHNVPPFRCGPVGREWLSSEWHMGSKAGLALPSNTEDCLGDCAGEGAWIRSPGLRPVNWWHVSEKRLERRGSPPCRVFPGRAKSPFDRMRGRVMLQSQRPTPGWRQAPMRNDGYNRCNTSAGQ